MNQVVDINNNKALTIALKYADIEWYIFPIFPIKNGSCSCGNTNCKSPGKHPINFLASHGHKDATIDKDIIRNWWRSFPTANIGIHCRRSGLAVVDIDPRNGGLETLEALEAEHGDIYSDVLAFTGGGGEHRIFELPEGNGLPGKLGTGIDLKVNGYIVAEPSNHISGGEYMWEGSSDPTDGAIPSPLPDWIRQLAHQQTVNQDIEWGDREIDEETFGHLQSALAELSAEDREQWVNFGNALKPLGQIGFDLWDEWSQKSDKYDPADTFRVWRSCKPGSFNYESIFKTASEEGWINPMLYGGDAEVPDVTELLKKKAPLATKPLPDSFLYPPFNNLHKTIDWLDNYGIRSNRTISMVGALAIAQGAGARIYRSQQTKTPTTLYTALIARTGAGKDYIKQAYSDLFYEAGHPQAIGYGGHSSGAGIRYSISKRPGSVSFLDEFGDMLRHGIEDKGGAAKDKLSTYRMAFNTGRLESIGYAESNPKADDQEDIIDPCLSIVGLTTQHQFMSVLNDSMVSDGTINRFVVVEVTTKGCRNRSPDKAVPKWLIDNIQRIRSPQSNTLQSNTLQSNTLQEACSSLASLPPQWIEIPFDDEANDYIDELGMVDTDEGGLIDDYANRGYVEAEMCTRWVEIAMRLAVAIAVFEGMTTINKAVMEWCFNLVYHSGNEFVRLFEDKAQDSERGQELDKLHAMIKAKGKTGMTKQQFTNSKLGRKLGGMNRQAFVKDLLEGGRIREVIHNKATTWMAI